LDGVTDTPEKTREYAKIIRKKAQSLQFLAEDLSLLSRLENAQLPLDKQEEDLGVLVAELASEFSFHEADLCVETHLMSGLRVMVDREKIARVLNNLLQNSVKYKRPNLSPRVSLTLVRQRGASQPGGMALLTVSDNGIGVEQGDLPRLFDQFYRADVSRGRQSGSGLGLSIVRHLVRLHDGKIWIVNNPGGGLSVNIALPLAGS
jgi:signal transduction histidine kinase